MSIITLTINGSSVCADAGRSLLSVCEDQGIHVPHLCHHAGLTAHGSCRLCVVEVDGHIAAACLTSPSEGATITTESPRLAHLRLRLTQLLFTEGQHFCPSCEMSGQCQLQAMAYDVGMLDGHFPHAWPHRQLDASHPDVIIDRDRCIQCALCVRASQEQDLANVFALGGRGLDTTLLCNSESGQLADSGFTVKQHAAHICPTGALLPRASPYSHPVGTRLYDNATLHQRGNLRPDDAQQETVP
jgi:[NiFe] hydrogenase diaphorase moiety small subunit